MKPAAGRAGVSLSAAPLPHETARTRLRALREGDLVDFQAYRGDPAVQRWQGWQPEDDAAALAFLRDMAAATFGRPGRWHQLGIADRGSDRLIGDIGVQLHGQGGVLAELGFTLAPAAQGRGLATEAVAALITLLLRHTAVQRIVAVADTRNAASLRLLQRLGLRRFATLPGELRGEACLEHHFVRHRAGRLPARLRAARPADATAVAEVLALSRRVLMPFAPSPHSDDDLPRWVAGQLIPDGGLTLAESHGRVAGVLAVARAADADWIEQLYVHPAFAGGGIGAALLARALAWHGGATHPRPLRLYTFQANRHARDFYERHGFVALKLGDGGGNEEGCPDVLYERAAGAQ